MVKKKVQQGQDWFSGRNVEYTGSGKGHGLRRLIASGMRLDGNANTLKELGVHSLLHSRQVQLTGRLLDKIKSDPDMIASQNKLIAELKKDWRFRRFPFISKGYINGGVCFGGKRWSSSSGKENWRSFSRKENPLLHSETWTVGINELTWATRHATVYYTANVKSNGTIVISYHLIDQLDLSDQPGRSDDYNLISKILGYPYHEVVGGNSKMKINAVWRITTK